jgi:hypothetical protein
VPNVGVGSSPTRYPILAASEPHLRGLVVDDKEAVSKSGRAIKELAEKGMAPD